MIVTWKCLWFLHVSAMKFLWNSCDDETRFYKITTDTYYDTYIIIRDFWIKNVKIIQSLYKLFVKKKLQQLWIWRYCDFMILSKHSYVKLLKTTSVLSQINNYSSLTTLCYVSWLVSHQGTHSYIFFQIDPAYTTVRRSSLLTILARIQPTSYPEGCYVL